MCENNTIRGYYGDFTSNNELWNINLRRKIHENQGLCYYLSYWWVGVAFSHDHG